MGWISNQKMSSRIVRQVKLVFCDLDSKSDREFAFPDHLHDQKILQIIRKHQGMISEGCRIDLGPQEHQEKAPEFRTILSSKSDRSSAGVRPLRQRNR